MKRKIRGAIYDTETAKEIARWPGEIDEVEDCLYRTKSGKYFTVELNTNLIHDYPNEPYEITPLSRREAIYLASEVLGLDKARPFFEDEEEGEKTLSVRVPGRVYNILRDVAAERGTSMAKLIEELVNEGEPFGDDAETFDQIAKNERAREETMRKLREIYGMGGQS